MTQTHLSRLPRIVLTVLAALVAGHAGFAREPQPIVSAASMARSHELPPTILEAEARGIVTIKYIPNDSRSAQIIVTNRSRRPATLRLPAAFAGVPVLAQLGGQQGAGFGAGGI
ncbi:MAG: hypothetical protein EBZ59_09685, partial [Planctomycetia bacterium]|nr:hypothetical protein [Planctomycetia bacterium]